MHEADIHIRVAVLTISTSKYETYGEVRNLDSLDKIDDESGKTVVQELSDICEITEYRLVPDDMIRIQSEVVDLLKNNDAVITTGGTGITPTDVTVEAIEPVMTKKIDGFGEIYRMLSHIDVGAPAILSRTFACLIEDKVVFCLPGSPKAVKLGIKLIRDSLKHIITHAKGLK